MDIEPLGNWIPFSHQPFIISGPCSAETEQQVMETAMGLAAIPQVKVFRAGIWKPRTRPGAFEGVGTPGLKWLQRVKNETGLLVTVEVANPRHVEEALDHGIDILWIGARTVVNPFTVQEIAEAIAGHDIPVLVKNPLNPDLKAWMGALERLNQMGITRLIAVIPRHHLWSSPAPICRPCKEARYSRRQISTQPHTLHPRLLNFS